MLLYDLALNFLFAGIDAPFVGLKNVANSVLISGAGIASEQAAQGLSVPRHGRYQL